MHAMRSPERRTPPEPRDAPTPAPAAGMSRWELLVAALGLLVLVAILAVMAIETLGGPAAPPDVTVRVEAPRRLTSGWLVPFEAHNAGDETAASVVLRATAASGEEVEATLDYVPGHSRRRGGFVFTKAEPTGIAARAIGWSEP